MISSRQIVLISYVNEAKQQGCSGCKSASALSVAYYIDHLTARLTADRCVRICTCESLELGLFSNILLIAEQKSKSLLLRVRCLLPHPIRQAEQSDLIGTAVKQVYTATKALKATKMRQKRSQCALFNIIDSY